MIVETIKLYPEREDVTLTTYVLQDSPELLDGANRPAVLICPGGAYLSCSDREAEPVAMRFAAMGYHAFVLRYSVYLDKHEPFESIFGGVERREHTVFPAAIRDIGKAMLTIHENSEAWLVDTGSDRSLRLFGRRAQCRDVFSILGQTDLDRSLSSVGRKTPSRCHDSGVYVKRLHLYERNRKR